MLKLYICPKCRSVRYVSLENITCYRCNMEMLLSDTSYADFIQLNEKQREKCVNDFLNRHAAFQEDITAS